MPTGRSTSRSLFGGVVRRRFGGFDRPPERCSRSPCDLGLYGLDRGRRGASSSGALLPFSRPCLPLDRALGDLGDRRRSILGCIGMNRRCFLIGSNSVLDWVDAKNARPVYIFAIYSVSWIRLWSWIIRWLLVVAAISTYYRIWSSIYSSHCIKVSHFGRRGAVLLSISIEQEVKIS